MASGLRSALGPSSTIDPKMLLFCVKTIVKESRKFELARLKKKKEKHFFFAVW